MGDNRIHNLEKIKRPVSFDGLPHVRRCSPSDVDFAIEIKALGKSLFGDFKEESVWEDRGLSKGQKMLLEHIVTSSGKAGYLSRGFVAVHPDDCAVIDAASSVLVLVYKDGEWTTPPFRPTLKSAYETFFEVVA